ncbi:MAG: hypothetical protein DDT37_01562 [Firmicutes bacterium]|nr:hypothetical protein [candidate division NPL-UPA2 bacterium]
MSLVSWQVNIFFDRVMLQFALANPEVMSMLRVFEKVGYHRHNRRLNDESDAHKKVQEAKIRKSLAVLCSYDRGRLSAKVRLSRDIMEWFLSDMVEGQKFSYHNYPVNQLFGVQNQLPTFLATMHQINNRRDAGYYLSRLSQVRLKFEQVIEGLRIRENQGIIPPRFVLDKVIAEIEGFVGVPAEENILYTSAADKINKLSGMIAGEKTATLARISGAINDAVYPAYHRLKDYILELRAKATGEDGVWKLERGSDYYAHLLRHYTSTTLSAGEIHGIGLSEVARIQSEMAAVLERLGYVGKHPVALLNELSLEERFRYPDTAAGRAQVLKDYKSMIDRLEGSIDHLFDLRPKVGVIVERIPEFKEKTAPGAYYNPPAMDGSRPGVFSVNLYQMPVKIHMETLAFHEATPGHHFQRAIQQALKGLPIFRRLVPFTAYAEGWALYAEKLCYEHGLFSDDYSVLGYLASELFRAVRLVVDTGIHHKRWTREEAIEYMAANTGNARNNTIAEVERYIVMPGQATAYKVGELAIVRMREKAKQQLGDAFDIREFHNVLLSNGSVPLTILESLVDEWVYRGIQGDGPFVL